MGYIKLWEKDVKQKVSHLGRAIFTQFPKIPFGYIWDVLWDFFHWDRYGFG